MPSIDRMDPRIDQLAHIVKFLSDTAVEAVTTLNQKRKNSKRKDVSSGRQPIEEAPLWNALAEAIRPHLARRGAKANLARVLGIPRQRVYDYLTRRSAMPDAEVVLHLILWLANQESLVPRGRHARPVA